jgi:hypothetical protein
MMLGQFACYQRRFIMLSCLNAGDIETFVTYQNYYGSKIPVWFWNIREIIEAFRNLDYSLIYQSLFGIILFRKGTTAAHGEFSDTVSA